MFTLEDPGPILSLVGSILCHSGRISLMERRLVEHTVMYSLWWNVSRDNKIATAVGKKKNNKTAPPQIFQEKCPQFLLRPLIYVVPGSNSQFYIKANAMLLLLSPVLG